MRSRLWRVILSDRPAQRDSEGSVVDEGACQRDEILRRDGGCAAAAAPQDDSDGGAGSEGSATGRARDRGLVPAAFLLVLLAYLTVWGLIPKAGVWICDEGARMIAAEWMAVRGRPTVTIPYPARKLDPGYCFFPFPTKADREAAMAELTPAGPVSVFPPALPYLSSLLLGPLGFPGLYVIPLVSALVALWAMAVLWRIAGGSRTEAAVSVLLLGLLSPLWFYAVTLWDHAPALACVAVGTCWALVCLKHGDWRWALAAGVACGAGVWFRDEVYLWVGAVAVALWLCTRAARPTLALVGGAAVSILPLWAVNLAAGAGVLGYHAAANTPATAVPDAVAAYHLLLCMGTPAWVGLVLGLPTAAAVLLALGGLCRGRPPWRAERWRAVVRGPAVSPPPARPGLRPDVILSDRPAERDSEGSATCEGTRRQDEILRRCGFCEAACAPQDDIAGVPRSPRSRALAAHGTTYCVLALAAGGAVLASLALFTRRHGDLVDLVSLNSLAMFPVFPVFAALWARTSADSTEAPTSRFLLTVIVAYVAACCLLAPRFGVMGVHHGPRVLLPAFLILSGGAAHGIVRVLSGGPRLRRTLALLAVVVALVATLAVQAHVGRLLFEKKQLSAELSSVIAQPDTQVVLTSLWWIGQELAPVYLTRRILYTHSPREELALLDTLAQQGVTTVRFIGGKPHPTGPIKMMDLVVTSPLTIAQRRSELLRALGQ